MRPNAIDELVRREFVLSPGLIYLNHAAVAPWPKRTADAVTLFAQQNATLGASRYADWVRVEQDLRRQCARLINSAAEDIAFAKNTSEALSIIAHGFPWQSGDNVVIPAGEFPSNRIVWDSLKPYGVSLREVDIGAGRDPEAELIAATDGKTRLISVSSVQYATGLRLDLARLGEACTQKGVAFCVDAIQGLGALPHDVSAMHIDFLAADAHKWLLGPEGIAVFYCRPEWRERLSLHEFGWHMVENAQDFDQTAWRPEHDARRFEPGSPNMLGIHAFSASLSLLLDVGVENIEERLLERSQFLFERLAALAGFSLLTRREAGRYAGIVTFRPETGDIKTVFESLKTANVICAARGGGIRFSPHFYTPLDKLDAAIALLSK